LDALRIEAGGTAPQCIQIMYNACMLLKPGYLPTRQQIADLSAVLRDGIDIHGVHWAESVAVVEPAIDPPVEPVDPPVSPVPGRWAQIVSGLARCILSVDKILTPFKLNDDNKEAEARCGNLENDLRITREELEAVRGRLEQLETKENELGEARKQLETSNKELAKVYRTKSTSSLKKT
jgi:hypothetical protein